MLKVLIVDDEAIVRVGIKSIINWEENGFELIGEASNGKIAYELIIKEHPDIVLTDISMPIINGIELISKVKEIGLEIEFIVLSCHDDFEFVKKAMKMGVDEYFLKLNMEPEDLLSELLNVKEKILKKSIRRKSDSQVERNIYQNIPVMREKVFKDLIFGYLIDKMEIREKMKLLNIELFDKNLFCLSVSIDHFYQYEEYGEEHIRLINFSILNIIQEILNDFMPGYVFYNKPGKFVIVLSSYENTSEINFNNKVILLTTKISDFLKQYLDISASIGISKRFTSIINIKKGYFQSEKALEYRFFKGKQSIIGYDEIQPIDIHHDSQLLSGSKELSEYIIDADIEGIEAYFCKMNIEIQQNVMSRQNAYILCLKIVMGFINYLHKEKDEIDKYIETNYDPNIDINRLENLKDIEEWLLWLRDIVIKYVCIKSEENNKNTIFKAKKFISKNYIHPITSTDIAEYLNISPSYFSSYFKKETGESVTSYITNIKIEKAKGYIKNTDMKMYEIAEAVGYSNVYYFSKVFKKNVGKSPNQYKERFKISF